MEIDAFNGLRSHVADERFEPGDLSVAQNVVIDQSGAVERRSGTRLRVSGAAAHSIWSDDDICLVVLGTTLYRITVEEVGSTVRIVTAGVDGPRVCYARIADRVFWSDGEVSGAIDLDPVGEVARTWGLAVPGPLDLVAEAGGELDAGQYQVSATYIRTDGQEGGASEVQPVVIESAGAIGVSFPPVPADSDIVAIRVYLSAANGMELHEATTLPIASLSVTLRDRGSEAAPLETAHLVAPPPADHLAVFAGRVLMAQGAYLFATEALGPELHDPRVFWPFSAPITMLAPSNDGVFVGTANTTYFLAGTDPESWELREVEAIGVRAGSNVCVPARLLGLEGFGDLDIPVWCDRDGVRAGLPLGQTLSLTAPRYRLEETLRDAPAGLHRHGETLLYLCAL